MKIEDTFHWYIYICSRLCKKHYSFICRHWFENFVFVMLAWTDAKYYSSSFFFFMSWPSCWKTHFSFVNPTRPAGKRISPLLAQCKNHLSFAGLAHKKNRLSFTFLAWLIVKIIFHLPAWLGPQAGPDVGLGPYSDQCKFLLHVSIIS